MDDHYEGRFTGNRQSSLEARFRALCHSASEYLTGLVETRGHSLRQQMEQIVELTDIFTEEELEWAMTCAVHHKSYGYGVLRKILLKRRQSPDALPGQRTMETSPSPLPHIGIEQRDLSYYAGQMGEEGEKWTKSPTA